MRPLRPISPTFPARGRRGVTLLEMLVTVALLVLIMSILVAIFQSATGAIDVQQKFAVIDQDLRRAESTLRSDLGGVTAPLDPPLNPNDNLGYFTLEENLFADLQGEDTDDVMAFTAKAPPGQPFVGRVWVAKTNFANAGAITIEPVTITSDFAEIIYFLRNGNLYRRVLLVKPDLHETLGKVVKNAGTNFKINNIPNDFALPPGLQDGGFQTTLFGANSPVSWLGFNDISCRPPVAAGTSAVPIPNSLGDLTNRENRFATPRFRDDYINNTTGAAVPDGQPDDINFDGVPDYYPTLYPGNPYSVGTPAPPGGTASYDVHGFPWVFPGMYSNPYPAVSANGSIHDLGVAHGTVDLAGPDGIFGTPDDILGVAVYNHAPVEFGESALSPGNVMPSPGPALLSTWWGRPTWKETLDADWQDPWYSVRPGATTTQAFHLSWDRVLNGGPLPLPPLFTFPNNPAAGLDGNPATSPSLRTSEDVWEDDLLLAGVRSFDIKVYDDNGAAYGGASDYYDLGYGQINFPALENSTPPLFFSPAYSNPRPHHEPSEPIGFGHEGRMPPRLTDNRINPYFPYNGVGVNAVGDNSNTLIRLRRTFDTWSTDYTAAPSLPVDPSTGPYNGFPPTLPSYPAPYPVPLTGIQIQIRAVDPSSQHIRTLTITHDFQNTSDRR